MKLVLDEVVQHKEWHSVYLHVQTSNDDAIDFYGKFGFSNVGTIEGYYKRVDPPNCYILEKVLTHTEAEAKSEDKTENLD